MKSLTLAAMLALLSGCSATILNSGSPFAMEDKCGWWIIPAADLAASAAVMAKLAKEEESEYQRNKSLMLATGLAISSIMGAGEVRDCHENK